MKRLFLGIAALGLLLVATETASARPWWGVSAGYGWGGPYVGASYGTRVGNNGFVSVGVSAPLGGYGYSYPAYGYGYPSYGYSYAPTYYSTPVYDYSYSTPVYSDTTYTTPTYDSSYTTPVYSNTSYTTPTYYYSTPVYYSTPTYYSSPSFGISYYRGGRWGWGW
jgi:hypothetical protein